MTRPATGRQHRGPVLLWALALWFVASSAAAQQAKMPPPAVPAQQGALPLPGVGKRIGSVDRAPGEPLACETSKECADAEGYGHVCVEGKCQDYVDRTDLFEVVGLKSKSKAPPEAYKLYLAALPVVGYAPANGVLIGATGTAAMYLGNPTTTTISSLTINAFYTAKSQVILTGTMNAMAADNDWELQGDYRFLIFNQPTYGLGTGTPAEFNGITIGGVDTAANGQPMDFDLFRFHQSVLRRVTGSFYMGGAYRLDTYWAINDQNLSVTSTPPVITSHYAYSQVEGFNPTTYAVSGVALELLFDSRDSTINPYRGVYANLSFGGNPTWLGSSQGSTLFGAQFRTYLGLSDAVPRNVLAFWFYGRGVTSGAMPYLALPSIGWDQQGTTGRGYIQGRFRGTAEIYGEAEWRFCFTNDGLLGGALFLSAETFSRPEASYLGEHTPTVSLFQYVAPAGGFGLRVAMNRQARINLRFDFAFGKDSFGVFIGTGEAF
jgi:hypothetical protein